MARSRSTFVSTRTLTEKNGAVVWQHKWRAAPTKRWSTGRSYHHRRRSKDRPASGPTPDVSSSSLADLLMLTRDCLPSYEFGGPWGVTAMMIGFPILMYYLWICLWFYDGALVTPTSIDDIVPFLQRMWVHVRDVSCPSPPFF
jgi:hypothetical protein